MVEVGSLSTAGRANTREPVTIPSGASRAPKAVEIANAAAVARTSAAVASALAKLPRGLVAPTSALIVAYLSHGIDPNQGTLNALQSRKAEFTAAMKAMLGADATQFLRPVLRRMDDVIQRSIASLRGSTRDSADQAATQIAVATTLATIVIDVVKKQVRRKGKNVIVPTNRKPPSPPGLGSSGPAGRCVAEQTLTTVRHGWGPNSTATFSVSGSYQINGKAESTVPVTVSATVRAPDRFEERTAPGYGLVKVDLQLHNVTPTTEITGKVVKVTCKVGNVDVKAPELPPIKTTVP